MTDLPLIQIDRKRCVRCGFCARDCLAGVIESDADGYPRSTSDAANRCFRCQHCLAVCPTCALVWAGKSGENSESTGALPTAEAMFDLLRRRRSVRNYRAEDVAPETIDRLHRAMAFVPTGCNDHRLFFSYSERRETTDRFRVAAIRTVLKRIREKTLPKAIARFERLKDALEAGADVFFRGAPHFVAIAVARGAQDAHVDPFIAASHFELLANCFDLGACWSGMATDLFLNEPELARHLNLPPEYVLKTTMLFGRPAIEYPRITQPEPCGRAAVAEI